MIIHESVNCNVEIGMVCIVSNRRGDVRVNPGSVCYNEKDTKCSQSPSLPM